MIVRRDLEPGQQAVQSAHAAIDFHFAHPELSRSWHMASNTLALLSVPNEHALGVLYRQAIDRDIPVTAFREPDLGDSLTAIALGPEGKKLTKGLPLTLPPPRKLAVAV